MTEDEAKIYVREFFDLLEKMEESDSGRKFQPNYISSCRVLDSQRFKVLITSLKEWAEEKNL